MASFEISENHITLKLKVLHGNNHIKLNIGQTSIPQGHQSIKDGDSALIFEQTVSFSAKIVLRGLLVMQA